MTNNVLYQVKELEKIIFRKFCNSEKIEKIEKNINKFHVTPTQMRIIEYILENKNRDIYQSELEEVLHLRRATVSGVLQTMEKNLLIERIIDKEDTRKKRIILSKNTKQIFIKNSKKMEELEQIAIKNIDKSDIEIFTKVIKKMKENIEGNF